MKETVLAMLLISITPALNAERIDVTQTEEGFLFTQGSATKILFYQRRPKSLDGKYERANYVHPLYDLDGNVLTEDFPQDHPHHRGIFWAWHQVLLGGKNAGDSWSARDFTWDVTEAKVIADDGNSAALDVEVTWKSRLVTDETDGPKPLVKEMTTIRAHHVVADHRKIDFEIRLSALQQNVRLGGSDDDKGYGGFSTRIRLPQNIRFVGGSGDLTPQRTAVECGAWLDMTASFGADESIGGLAILCHPSLPGFPQSWILRSSRSMQNPVFPGRDPVLLSTKTPLVLRYCLVVHRGETDRTKVQQWEKEYAGETIDFEAAPEFPRLPDTITLGACSAVAVNSKGEIYLAHRGKQPILCLDASGKFLRSWGDDFIRTVHALRIDRDDNVWVTDIGNHQVLKFNPMGKLLLALGKANTAGNGMDEFNKPTDVAFGPNGEIYVADGYGNSRVMEFTPNGGFLTTWGEPGKGPGQFNLPHSIIIDSKGRVLVGDRENNRVQVFDAGGKLLDIWPGFAPYGLAYDTEGNLFVADGRANKVLQLDAKGKIIGSWGGRGTELGQFNLPHMLAADTHGNLYIGEVQGKRFQKLTRR